MPKSRYAQISIGKTPYVHVASRTVRRSFLCGKDKYSGKNFNSRREWLEEDLLRLSGIPGMCVHFGLYGRYKSDLFLLTYYYGDPGFCLVLARESRLDVIVGEIIKLLTTNLDYS